MIWVVVVVIILFILFHKPREKKKELQLPPLPPLFTFSDGITQQEFESIVMRACKPIKRLTVLEIDGPRVKCQVRTSSGISTWRFSMNFDDAGHLTGHYWLDTDNSKSIIPHNVGDEISEEIKKRLRYSNPTQSI